MEEKMYSYKYPHPAVTTDCVIFGFWIWICQFPLLIHLLHLMAYDVDYPV